MSHTSQIVQLFDHFADAYQEKYANLSHYSASFDLFIELLEGQRPEVLELGCGPGNLSRCLLDRQPSIQLLGTDLSPNMLRLARRNVPEGKFQSMDCRALRQLNRSFDGIVGGFCLPYLSPEDAVQLIEDAAQVLNPRGVLYLSTMEDEPRRSGFIGPADDSGGRMYTWYHQGDHLIAALMSAGFQPPTVIRQDFPGAEDATFHDLILIAQI